MHTPLHQRLSSPRSSESLLFDRVYGCLLGMCAGDALGQPARGLDWRRVQETSQGIRWFLPWPSDLADGEQHSPGEVGDLARFTVGFTHRASRMGVKPRTSVLIDELFAQKNLDSLPAQAALARINAGIEPSRSAVPELAGPEALYLAVPLGIAHIGDPEVAFTTARAVVGPILLGPSLEIGQVFAAAVAEALMPESTPSSVLEQALELAPPSSARVLKPAATFAREHLGHPPSLLMPTIHDRFSSKSATDPHGPAMESLAVACIFMYTNDGLPQQATLASASYGGWSQATAAAAGALCGAISGAKTIPLEWERVVTAANPMLDLRAAAEGLCKIIEADRERQSKRLEQLSLMAVEPQPQQKAA